MVKLSFVVWRWWNRKRLGTWLHPTWVFFATKKKKIRKTPQLTDNKKNYQTNVYDISFFTMIAMSSPMSSPISSAPYHSHERNRWWCAWIILNGIAIRCPTLIDPQKWRSGSVVLLLLVLVVNLIGWHWIRLLTMGLHPSGAAWEIARVVCRVLRGG